jgi:hypothetical protein
MDDLKKKIAVKKLPECDPFDLSKQRQQNGFVNWIIYA